MSEVLGLIPARGHSKGLPRKNLALIADKPLMAWTIEAARQSQRVNRVVVSSEDEEIIRIAREWGAETPFVRPAELAQDETPGIAPLLHAIHWLAENEGYHPRLVVCLQPTSPLRTFEDIDAAVDLFWQKHADAVVSVTLATQHPYWMKQTTSDGRLIDFVKRDPFPSRRQELPPLYALNGALYLAQPETLIKEKTFHTERTYAYVMPPERSVDIDTEWDLHLAELLLRKRLAHERN